MAWHPMKPETAARRARGRVAERAASSRDLAERLRQTADDYAREGQHDRADFWRELLAAHNRRAAQIRGE